MLELLTLEIYDMAKQMASEADEWVKVPDAAALIGCTADVLRRRLNEGDVKERTRGFAAMKRRREIHRSEIQRLKDEYIRGR